MKKIILFFFFLPLLAGAQKNVQGLIAAETKFAATAAEQGTKNAFLQSLDSTQGIVFDKGQPVSAYTYWSAALPQRGLLSWMPADADVSSSGDFGYTTGPWIYKPTPKDTIEAAGQYLTVWHYVKGQWKFLVDLGVTGLRTGSSDTSLPVPDATAGKPRTDRFPVDTALLLRAERDFNKTFTTAPARAYQRYLSPDAHMNRNGAPAAGDAAGRKALIARTSAAIRLQGLGYGIAPSGDMAYTYGRATLKGRADSYLRIWQRDRSGWKMIVEVLRY